MNALYELRITYVNGSVSRQPFDSYSAVRDAYQHGISYSGGRVRRVEVEMVGGELRVIWDISWDEVSQQAGLIS